MADNMELRHPRAAKPPQLDIPPAIWLKEGVFAYDGSTNKTRNDLFIMADDIGWFNASCYNHGMMGYETPNIDRIAKEGGDVH